METQIFINGTEIDIFDNVAMPFNFAIADIRNPQNRNSSYSKTISVPGTDANNKLFGHIWDINTSINSSGILNFNPSFNPNFKANAIILYQGVEEFRGFVQLLRINNIDNIEVSYELSFQNTIGNLFTAINDKYLSDLDLSTYNHTYTLFNQRGSWDNFIWKNSTTQAFSYGEGYVYPMIDYGYNNGVNFDVKEMFPAIYAKTLVDNIFSQNGFQYSSSFFTSSFFKRLIVPYCGGNSLKISDTTAKARGFRASKTSNQSYNYAGASSGVTVTFQDETTSPNWDTGGVFDNVTNFYYTCPAKATYKANVTPIVSIVHHPPASPPAYIAYDYQIGTFLLKKIDYATGTTSIVQSVPVVVNSTISNVIAITAQNPISNGTTSSTVNASFNWQGLLEKNDILYVTFEFSVRGNYTNSGTFFYATLYDPQTSGLSGSVGGSIDFRIQTNSAFSVTIADPSIMEGDTVDITNTLPDKIKQSDFIKSLCNMFNLYIHQDYTIENKLIIEPRDDIYASSGVTTVDWTSKLDYSKPIESVPMGELNAKTWIYKYKEDKDYFNELYQNKYGETYGQRRNDIDNDFLKNTNVNEVIFSPTPLADNIGHDRVIPRIFTTDDAGVIKPAPCNIRILYYGGMKTTNNPWNHLSSSGITTSGTFPYAGHLDDVSNPTVDLSFGIPKEVFYTANKYTDNNNYNKYHRKYFNEISDKDSRIVTAYFHLRPTDVYTLDFRNKYYFEQSLFRLNKVIDHDRIAQTSTKCEFIKIKEASTFTATNGFIYGGDTSLGVELSPTSTNRTSNFNNHGGNSIGKNNFIDPTSIGCFITGTNNSIGAGCSNVSILSSSGVTVYGGVSNASVLNSSGVIVSQSGTMYINGIKTLINKEPFVTTATGTIPENTSIVIVNSGSATSQYLRDIGSVNFIEIEIVNIGAGNANFIPYSTQLIDGLGSLLLNQYESAKIFSYGNNWYTKAKNV